MYAFTKLRQWVNRDNGRFYRLGNRQLGVIEMVGLLLFVVALVLWQLHAKAGISPLWSLAGGVVGLLLAIVGARGDRGALAPNISFQRTRYARR